jgi:hypothetical protein
VLGLAGLICLAGLMIGCGGAAPVTTSSQQATAAASPAPPSSPPPPTLGISTTSLSAASTGAAYLASLTATGGTPPYTWSLANGTLPPGVVLGAGGQLAGTPTSPGSYQFTAKVTDFGAPPQSAAAAFAISVQSPAGQLTVVPGTVDFGNVVAGATATMAGQLVASGSTVTVTSASLSGPFSASGLSFPFQLAAGGSISYQLVFAPQGAGTASGTLTFSSNASSPSTVQLLAATGVTPPPVPHSVELTWNPSPATVVGYNVYRGSRSGGPYVRVNSAVQPATSYIDTAIQSGQTYFYLLKAVDADSVESDPSNEAVAVVPTP